MKKLQLAALAAAASAMLAPPVSAAWHADITEVSADGASLYITKTADTAVRCIAAAYGESGELLGVSVSDEIPASNAGEMTVNVNLAASDASTVKYFVWETDALGELTMSPACEAYVPVKTEPSSSPSASPDVTEGGGVVHLLGDSIDASSAQGVTVSGTTADITAPGEYTFDGSLNDGSITVSAPKDSAVTVNLCGVSVTSSSGDAFSASNGKITLSAAADTVNTFTASAAGARGIYSKQDLTLKSAETGKITAVSTTDNGIQSKKDIEIGAGIVEVNAANNGIKGAKSVKITKKNNSVTVTSGGDSIKSDLAPGLDADTGEYTTGGIVKINGGVITVNASSVTESDGTVSTGDGIQADTLLEISGGTLNITADGEALKANASSLSDGTPEEGDGCVVITGGDITASAGEDGVKAVKSVEISDAASLTITKSEDGIQVNDAVYDTDGTTVTAYVAGSVSITGGTVNITSSEDGVQCGTGDVTITGGDITVSSLKDCIQADGILNVTGGTLDLTANGGAGGSKTEESCKGLKGAVLVNIAGGTIDIDAYDDAVHSNDTVRISGGNITLASGDDGVHGDSYLIISDSADINVTKSYEGIEAAKIYITGGKTRVVSSDDGANAAGEEPSAEAKDLTYSGGIASVLSADLFAGPGGWGGPNWGGEDSSSYGYMEVSGGILYIEAEGDGFDSNGDALISGGTVLVNGPTNGGNGVFDVGDNGNTLKITGGTVIGAGTSDMAVTPSSDTASQYYVVTGSSSGGGRPGQGNSSGSLSSQAAGSAFMLADTQGGEVALYVPSKKYSWVLVSTPDMTSGSYTLSYGGSVSGGEYTSGSYGLVTGGAYSGGTAVTLTAQK